jgi:integrase
LTGSGELVAARWDEFELEADPPVWHLPGIRTKTGQPLDIPLPTMAVEWLRKLNRSWPATPSTCCRRASCFSRMVPHVCVSTLGVAMGKVKHGLPHFTVHDFRRTARTHLAALGVEPHVAERCLNHKLRARTQSPEGDCGWRAPGRNTCAQARAWKASTAGTTTSTSGGGRWKRGGSCY